MRTLIQHGTLVSPTDTFKSDLVIEDEKIAAVGTDLQALYGGKFDKIVDASGKYVIPGGIDVHTHMEMPFGGTVSVDDFESGTVAAAFGGTTTIVDFAMQPQKEGGGSLHEGLATWHEKAAGKAVIDYGFHMIMRHVSKTSLREMERPGQEGGSHFFQAVHRLSRRLLCGRCVDLSRAPADGRQRRFDLHARRERAGDRRDHRGGEGPRRDRSGLACADPPAAPRR